MALIALVSCNSDSRDGNPDYLASLQLTAETSAGNVLFLLDNGDGTVSITYDHRNPMHLNDDNLSASYAGKLVVPEAVTVGGITYRVVGVGDYAFLNCTGLTSVQLPTTVTRIGKMAFYGCKALEQVNIPTAVREIPERCFYGCKALTDVTLSEGLTSIGYESFRSCAFEKIILPGTLTTIRKFAFAGCSSLDYLSLPAKVTALTDSVFYNCSKLKKLLLPETLTTLGIGTFAGCRSLSEVTIPASVTTIGRDCFSSLDSKTGESNWKNITIVVRSATPPTLTGAIANATDRRDLIVPRGSREAYEQAPYWNEFTKIFERNFEN